ncbi:alkyldihydroxyacetonephosphate synthase AgpS domain protein [Mycobacterium kansasii]|uniref:Alkyldihydroxyacetonephosphate synthase AgpS domain protein n=1 Tax=Mycobacterium kansasii TaxID=1768 RepID=A0A1V3XW31_MYCKA|nr:alkyldihydroxyacetonephosphate synthase AgpS domain protein [Mycobacterium kansasii]
MRSWWGWGDVEEALSDGETQALAARVATLLPGHDLTDHQPPDPGALGLAPRGSPRRRRWPGCARPTSSIAPGMRAARHFATSHATCRAASTMSPI